MGFSTDAVHAGQAPDPATGAIMTPIYLSSTYVQPGLGREWPFDYSRTINPTRLALEKNIAVLEGGKYGSCFSSGMSAIHAVTALLKKGDHVVVSRNVYGGTFRLFDKILIDFGLEFSWVDASQLEEVKGAIKKNTKMVFIETPSNPLMVLSDLKGVSKICKRKKLIHVVDNTFMTPFFQKPLDLGADIVVHSTTKYLNGHSDSLGGAVVTSNKRFAEKIKFFQKSAGAVLSPFESWMVLRGIKTLPLRMERHDYNGRKVAQYLSKNKKVKEVLYPGLESYPQFSLAKKQMSGYGGMVSFDVGTYRKAKKLLESLKLCALAGSLGGVETLISHPASMTHAFASDQERRRLGITDGLVRISVGIEDVEDIIQDLKRGFKAI